MKTDVTSIDSEATPIIFTIYEKCYNIRARAKQEY